MKNVKTTFAIFISVFYSTINAQEKKESQEAFDEMAKKNPSLLKLSDEFGLELN